MERVILRHLKGSKASQLEEFPLAQFAELVIGRDPNSGIRFDPDKDDLVGRQHARISRDAAEPYRFKLTDLNSRNGTFLNKLRVVGDMPLQPGDVIQLGAGGPELQFDIDPLPAMYVKATRLGNAGASGSTGQSVAETKVSGTAPVAGASGAAAGGHNAIGKATVERMIGETRNQTRRNMYVGMAAVLAVVVGVFGYNRMKVGEQLNAESAGNAKLRDSLRVAQASGLDSLGQSLGRAGELSKQLQPSEIAAKYSGAVVQVDFSWKLTYRGTGGQVYHRLVPNAYKAKNGKVLPIIDDGRRNVPAYVQVQSDIEPALTLDMNSGRAIGVSSRGSGFSAAIFSSA